MDNTENVRREMVGKINEFPADRELLEKRYGDVYDTEEVVKEFEITGFLAPFITVRRRSDEIKGTMMFQHNPRFYFHFKEI